MTNSNLKLHDLPDDAFETGGELAEAFKRAGYVDGPRAIINSYSWWNRTVGDVLDDLTSEAERTASTEHEPDEQR